MNKTRSAFAALVVVLALALLLSACGGTTSTTDSPGAAADLSLSFIFPNDAKPGIIFYPYFIAEDLGFFADENLTVKAVPSDGSSAAVQQLVAGQADAGVPFSAATLDAYMKGYDTRYIYTYSTGQNFGIATLADSGIASVADLKGKVIGISEAEGGEVAVIKAALTTVGLDPQSDVEMIAIGAGSASTLGAIQNGEVDAYASSGGDMLLLKAKGLDLVDITPAEFKNFPAHGISATAKSLESKRDALIAFGRAWAKATLFSQTNRAAAESIMMRLSPAEFEDPVLGKTEMKRLLDITVVPDGALYGAPNIAAWDAYNQFRLIAEPGAKLADLGPFLVGDLIPEINNFDHAAVIKMAEEYTE